MKVVESIADLRDIRRADPALTWGFVPTMGFLHDGHISLVGQSVRENDRTAVSIFVNPAQFNDPGDLAAYPRDIERDLALLRKAGADLVWTPEPETVYPPDFQTHVDVGELSRPLEGAARPGHFRGVATVVAKLFNAVQPDRAYFGQKDAQQAAVIRRMVIDLNVPVEIIVAPTVREPDGLAMSSRNSRLPADARQAATCLYRALSAAQVLWNRGERRGDILRAEMRRVIAAEPLARIDYVSVADPETLVELEAARGAALFSLAVFVGGVRLIDNVRLTG